MFRWQGPSSCDRYICVLVDSLRSRGKVEERDLIALRNLAGEDAAEQEGRRSLALIACTCQPMRRRGFASDM